MLWFPFWHPFHTSRWPSFADRFALIIWCDRVFFWIFPFRIELCHLDIVKRSVLWAFRVWTEHLNRSWPLLIAVHGPAEDADLQSCAEKCSSKINDVHQGYIPSDVSSSRWEKYIRQNSKVLASRYAMRDALDLSTRTQDLTALKQIWKLKPGSF